MRTLYRNPIALPSLLLALSLTGCDEAPSARQVERTPSNVYSEAIREAKALKGNIEERTQDQQRIDALLGRDQARSR